MHRLRVAAVLVLAVVLAAQLTLHNHSLIPEGGAAPTLACGVCAFGADRIGPDLPLAVALVLLGLIIARTPAAAAREVLIATAGRAPPRSLR